MELKDIEKVFVYWSESSLINDELGNVPEDSGDILKEVNPVDFDKLIKRASALVHCGYDKTCLKVTLTDGTVYGENGGCKFYLTADKDSLVKLIADV
jgi:hypothetical protein